MTRHPFDALSFTFGVLILIAGVMLLSGRPSTDPLEWVGPLAAVGVGVVILIANLPRRGADAAAEADGAAPDEPMGDGGDAEA